jgi:hypothetical protein
MAANLLCRIQAVDAGDQLGNFGSIRAFRLVQRLSRGVQQFVCQAVGQSIQYTGRVFAARKQLEGMFDFMSTHSLTGIAQGADGGYRLA